MKDHQSHQTPASVEQLQAIDQQIMADMAAEGEVQTPVKVMAKRPGTLARFMAYHKTIFGDGPLTERERRLIAVAVGVARNSPKCIATHANAARKAGASEDEIVQSMLIASVMLGASPLRAAYSGIHKKA